jgi:hypothetical protein
MPPFHLAAGLCDREETNFSLHNINRTYRKDN